MIFRPMSHFDELKVFQSLTSRDREFLNQKFEDFRFSFQEKKSIVDYSVDFKMWREGDIQSLWPKVIPQNLQGKNRRQWALNYLKNIWNQKKDQQTKYSHPQTITKKRTTPKYTIGETDRSSKIMGQCPVASEKTRCCNLITLDIVQSCGQDCSYCSIQSFYTEGKIKIESNLKEKLAQIAINPNELYHFGTGQSSDSLMWGNKDGVLEDLLEFARNHPNVILEFKTKSQNIKYLLQANVPKNVICTWSLNPQIVIDHEEHFTASLEQRIAAARSLADKGIIVGFHFHPIIYIENFEHEYGVITNTLLKTFSPQEVALISLGTLTFTKKVIQQIRLRKNYHSKILQMPMVNASGKWSYPNEIKIKLFKTVYDQLAPWHQDIFFYLCMENHSLWKSVFGFEYDSNNSFEKSMKESYFKSMTTGL